MNRKYLFTLLIVNSLFISTIYGQKPAIDSFINNEIQKLHIAGFAAVAIDSNKIVWQSYYGYQNVEKKIPVTERTLFMIASTSKTVTAAALMQLYSMGKFHLDDDINKYLDFKVVNPNYPKIPITFRQLLRHRSSIADKRCSNCLLLISKASILVLSFSMITCSSCTAFTKGTTNSA